MEKGHALSSPDLQTQRAL